MKMKLLTAAAALVACLGAWAEPITFKGFYAAMTADQFIAHAKSVGAINIQDCRPKDEYGQEVVTAEFSKCLERLSGTTYCITYAEASNLSLGGAKIETASWIAEDTYQRVNLSPIAAHRVTLNEAIRLKFGPHDREEVINRHDMVWTEYWWVQDLDNKMILQDTASSVTLWKDLNAEADIDDF